jgi:hypothetical protein
VERTHQNCSNATAKGCITTLKEAAHTVIATT